MIALRLGLRPHTSYLARRAIQPSIAIPKYTRLTSIRQIRNATTVSSDPEAQDALRHIIGEGGDSQALIGGEAVPKISPPRKHGFVYLDSCFPIRFAIWDIRYLLSEVEKETFLEKVKQKVPKDLGFDFKVEGVEARAKDGGAFLHFSYLPLSPPKPSPPSSADGAEGETTVEDPPVPNPDASSSSTSSILSTETSRVLPVQLRDPTLKEIEKKLCEFIENAKYTPWWLAGWGPGRAFLVKGKPWLEDMDRFPNKAIKIDFEGPEIPQEDLYSLLRPYGKIRNIVPQPPSNKDTPRFANVIFSSIRSAASARNCLHGYPYKFNDASGVLRVLYFSSQKGNAWFEWMSSHPRIVLPILATLLAGLGYTIFEPVRAWFIKTKVQGTLDVERNRVFKWLKRETLGRLGFDDDGAGVTSGPSGIEREREAAAEQLRSWLKDWPDTFITVTGPRGSGKTGLIQKVMSGRKNVLEIDCSAILKEARNDAKLVSALAQETGYFPQFSFLTSLNNLIDLASVGLIGQKAGFTSSLDAQLKQVLDTTGVALKQLADGAKSKKDDVLKRAEYHKGNEEERNKFLEKARTEGVHDGRIACLAGNGIMSELGHGMERDEKDDWTIVGPSTANTAREYSAYDREKKTLDPAADIDEMPVVVIKGYYSKEAGEKQDILWDVLADWSAALVENGIAHVVFTSDNITITKPLSKALPSKPFNSIGLTDATSENAIQYVQTKLLDAGTTSSELPTSFDSLRLISVLGGRQSDLEVLVQKIRSGQRLEDAVEDIVARSSTELLKNIFGGGDGAGWTLEQAWVLCKGLSEGDELKYADVLTSDAFKGDEKALQALEYSEMIAVSHKEGRPSTLRAGRPVYRSAFSRLTSDPVFSATQELSIATKYASAAESTIRTLSDELISLSQLFGGKGGSGRWIFGGVSTVPVEISQRVDVLLGKMRDAEAKLEKLEKSKVELKKVLHENP